MASWGIRFHRGAVHVPAARLWLDAHEPIGPEEIVFVSHAHSDHTASHARVILSEPTQKFMRERVPGEREEHVLPFGQRQDGRSLGLGERALTLLPAGHIFGSAMSLLEDESGSLLYTGDFKLRAGMSAEPCEPRPAETLIMETTYGRPEYVFPPVAEVMAGVIRFCREALDNDEIPVLLGYSLGKSQEVLTGLAGAGLPVMLSEPIAKLTRVYESLGRQFPPYALLDPDTATGRVVLAPPGSSTAALRRRLGGCRVAVLTGWAVHPGCHFQFQADAAFPLSDHADFPDLVEFVKRVAPRRVFTLHGFAADFAAHLRRLGFDARALGEAEQLDLPALDLLAAPGKPSGKTISPSRSEAREREEGPQEGPDRFFQFARTCEQIGAVTSKREKQRLLAAYLRQVPSGHLRSVVTWFTGAAFSASSNRKLALGWSLIRSAVCEAGGFTPADFRQVYLKHSDAGETAAEVLAARDPDRPSGPPLDLAGVERVLEQLESARGPTGKRPWLVEALNRCSPREARFFIKILTGDLRIGLKEGLVENAAAEAFQVSAEDFRAAHQILSDLGETARLAREGGLAQAGLIPFRPVRVMLASPEPDAAAILRRVQGWNASGSLPPTGAWMEDKYDGIRCQLHAVGGRVVLFSRDLKDVTATFPELATAAQAFSDDVILDGEIVAMEGGRALPFGELQRRLGRRERDLFLDREIPVCFVAFDLLWQNGCDRLREPLAQRRRALDGLVLPSGFLRARFEPAHSTEEIERAFAGARNRGNEGLIIKDPASAYTPGRRGLSWLKLKRALATLDCVVVGAEYGHGRRKAVLSDYTFAVRDESTGQLKVIGKAYRGLTDAEIARLTTHFLARSVRQFGRFHEVVPDVVLEIAFDSIHPSPRHNSGLALRFPRIERIRDDKTPADIDTLATARRRAGLDGERG